MAASTGSFHLDYLLPIQKRSEHRSKIAQKNIQKTGNKAEFIFQCNPIRKMIQKKRHVDYVMIITSCLNTCYIRH